jgi:hypothetical protein
MIREQGILLPMDGLFLIRRRLLGRDENNLFLHSYVSYSVQGPYTETIDLWFEPFFAKEIRRVIEWLREIKTADQHCYKFLLIQQTKFLKLKLNYLLIM